MGLINYDHKSVRRITLWFCLVLAASLMVKILAPSSYDVPEIQKTPNLAYWELPTGSKIAYLHLDGEGDSSKSPIIYLHGGPGGLIRDEVVQSLKPLTALGHDLYFYDQIGSGHSGRLENITEYSVERHQKDLEAILEKIEAPQVILMGHSWGCLLAINYLQNHPKSSRIEKLILEVPGPILPVNTSLSSLQPTDGFTHIQPAYSNTDANAETKSLRTTLVKFVATRFGFKLGSDHEMDQYFTYWSQALNKSTACLPGQSSAYPGGGGYYAHIMTVRSFDHVPDQREALNKIQIPTLVIRAQCDNQPWGYMHEYLDLLPNSEWAFVEKSGHDLATSNTAQYQEVLHRFLANIN
jgi:proline iminopeptidase